MTEKKKSDKKTGESKEKVVVSLDFREIFDTVKKLLGQGKDAVISLEQDLEKKIVQAAKKGELSDEEIEKVMVEYRNKIKGRIDKMNEKVDQSVYKTLSALNIATKDDVKALETRLDTLLEKIDTLVDKPKRSQKKATSSKPKAAAAKPEVKSKTTPKSTAKKPAVSKKSPAKKATSKKSTGTAAKKKSTSSKKSA